MLIRGIGSSDDAALLCNTNHKPSGDSNSGGDWFAPNGTRVDHSGAISGFTRNRAPMVVRLKKIMGTQPEGIYKCSINDAASTRQTIFVGLYNSGRGMDFSNTQLHSFIRHHLFYCFCIIHRKCHIIWWHDFLF